MRNPKHLAMAAMVFSAFCASTAFGQADPSIDPNQVHPVIRSRAAAAVKLMDPNGTGSITKANYLKFFEQRWSQMDPNNTGTVSSNEILRRLLFMTPK